MTGSDQFEIFEEEFQRILGMTPSLTLLADSLTFAEGVCWVPDVESAAGQGKVIVSDIPNNRMVSWSEVNILQFHDNKIMGQYWYYLFHTYFQMECRLKK